ncbi:phosphonate ABC transporter, permease protein PhnE [Rhodococcus sp. HNM0569]|nr:phosphonate ABC transporter, permease protein PhnE [Rhodococcus sp. HNM0569]
MLEPGPRHAGPPERTVPAPRPAALGVAAILVAFAAAAVWSIVDLRINVASLVDSADNAAAFLSRVFPLDFPPVGDIARMTGQTLAIVVCATALSVVLSFAVALLAARNTTPSPSARWGARALIVIARAVPDLVLAIAFLRMFGLGALAGILALGIHSVGMVGKLYADAIEDTGAGPRDALRAAGATWWQQITGAVVPQAMPSFVATALHRFDINLRTSVVLGYVGVAGIGMELSVAMRTLDYSRGMALALLVVVLCIAVELVSGAARTRLLGRTRSGLAWVRAPRAPRPAAVRLADGRFRVSPPWSAARIRRTLYAAGGITVLAAALVYVDVDFGRAAAGLRDLPATAGLFVPPGTGGMWGELVAELIVTVQIALAATLLGIVLAIPVGCLAARTVSPSPAIATAARVFIVCVRGIPDLVVAIVFIVVTGLGATAGALALAVGAVGLTGKLVADSLEETDVRVQDAVAASGARRGQVFVAATLRQSAPALIAHVFYQLDVNIRSATLLGVVGAGGIGFYLLNATRVLQFDVVTTIVAMIFAVVVAVEAVALWIRKVLA